MGQQAVQFLTGEVASATVITAGRILLQTSTENSLNHTSTAANTPIGIAVDSSANGSTRAITFVSVNGGGYTDVEAGAAVTVGDRLTSDSSGRAIRTTTAGNNIIGVAKTAATAAGEVIEVWLTGGQV